MADKNLKKIDPADETPEVSAADSVKAVNEPSGQSEKPEEVQTSTAESLAGAEQAAQS